MNYLQGLAAAQCLQQEGVCLDTSVHALSAAAPRPPEGSWAGATSQGCTKAQESKAGGTFEMFDKCCLAAVKSPPGSVPRTAIPGVKLFQQGEMTSDVCRASLLLRATWSDT